MTARKPKPKPRKASGPTLEQRVDLLEAVIVEIVDGRIRGCQTRLDALEARKDLRDKSHDEPVSNAGEAVGMNLPLSDAAQIDRFFDFIRNEQLTRHWWQFWRRG